MQRPLLGVRVGLNRRTRLPQRCVEREEKVAGGRVAGLGGVVQRSQPEAVTRAHARAALEQGPQRLDDGSVATSSVGAGDRRVGTRG